MSKERPADVEEFRVGGGQDALAHDNVREAQSDWARETATPTKGNNICQVLGGHGDIGYK
jgi:hypothetical protein